MSPKELAEFLALLTMLEPDSIICKLTIRLAAAGTATEGETDTSVLKDVRANAKAIAAELATVDGANQDRRAALVNKFLGAVTSA